MVARMIVNDKLPHSSKIPLTGGLPTGTDKDFTFAIIGDRTGIATPGVFEKAMDVLQALRPDFVVSVGDLIEGCCENAEEAHEEWDEVDALVERLSLPLYQTVGNHDYGGFELMRDVWRERKGCEYYAFRYHDSLFLVVNTEASDTFPAEDYGDWRRFVRSIRLEPERFEELTRHFMEQWLKLEHISDWPYRETAGAPDIDDEQIEFFREVLEQNEDVRWSYVFMHQPGWKTNVPSYVRLMSLLQGRKYTAVAGHLHYMEVMEIEGIQHIQMGSTGAHNPHAERQYAAKPSTEEGNFEGKGSPFSIVWVSVKDGTPIFTVIPLQGIEGVEGFKRRTD